MLYILFITFFLTLVPLLSSSFSPSSTSPFRLRGGSGPYDNDRLRTLIHDQLRNDSMTESQTRYYSGHVDSVPVWVHMWDFLEESAIVRTLVRNEESSPQESHVVNYSSTDIIVYDDLIYVTLDKPTVHNKSRTSSDQAKTSLNSLLANLTSKDIIAFTDGSATPNPGPAGAGAYITDTQLSVEYATTRALGNGTNNLSELYGVHLALTVVQNCFRETDHNALHLFTDSKYVIGVFQDDWNTTTHGTLIRQIQIELDEVKRHYQVHFHWLQAHSGLNGNERADVYAGLGSRLSVRLGLTSDINEIQGLEPIIDLQTVPSDICETFYDLHLQHPHHLTSNVKNNSSLVPNTPDNLPRTIKERHWPEESDCQLSQPHTSPTSTLVFGLGKLTNIMLWNITTIHSPTAKHVFGSHIPDYSYGRVEELIAIMVSRKVDILMLNEVKLKGNGLKVFDNEWYLYWSGPETGQTRNGVGFLLSSNAHECMVTNSFDAVSDRLASIQFNVPDFDKCRRAKRIYVRLVVHYAPACSTVKRLKEKQAIKQSHYTTLSTYCNQFLGHELVILAGDCNTQIGKDKHVTYPSTVGPHCLSSKSKDHAYLMIQSMQESSLSIVNTRFRKRPQFLATNYVNFGMDKSYRTQVDYFAVSEGRFSVVQDCYVDPTLTFSNTSHRPLLLCVRMHVYSQTTV